MQPAEWQTVFAILGCLFFPAFFHSSKKVWTFAFYCAGILGFSVGYYNAGMISPLGAFLITLPFFLAISMQSIPDWRLKKRQRMR